MLHLQEEGDVQGVIRLVEAWDRNGDTTLVGVVAQARAFLALRLMDRAWVRLREAARIAPEDPDVLVLTAQVFIERGWPGRARRLIEQVAQVAPEHPALPGLQRRVQEPPRGPPADARELERDGSPAQLLALAESYLATGSFLRARSILERVRRAEPMNRRVELLLWGLQGEYLPRSRSLSDLVREALPGAEWEGVEHTESVRRAELGGMDPPTAEVTRGTLVAVGLAEPAVSDAFPSLFRRVSSETSLAGGGMEEEVTAASGLASPEQMREPPQAEVTDPGLRVEEEGGDTQIMQVIPGPGGGTLAEVTGPIHHAPEQPEPLRETLDLRAWQQSMGMAAAGVDELPPEEDDFLEAEDEDVVVMTRREESEAPPPAPPPARSGPIEVVDKRPVPEAMVASAAAPAEPVAAPRGPPAPLDEPDPRPTPQRWGRVALVILLMAAIMTAATAASVHYLHAVVASRALDEAERTLAAGDYRGLLELEARLDAAVRAGTAPVEARALSLAMVEAVLWGEYSGNPAHRQRAQDALQVAMEAGASGRDLALAEGMLALVDGDVERAAVHSDAAGAGTETGRYLAARVAQERGEAERALELWGASETVDAQGVRHRLLREDLLRQAGQVEAADAAAGRLLEVANENPLVQVAALTRGWGGGAPDARLAAIDALLERAGADLAPRQQAALHMARARLLQAGQREAEALDAWRRAAAADVTNPAPIAQLGAVALARNEVLQALGEFQRCVAANPHDRPCRRGLVQVALDLDRLDTAEQALAGAQGAQAELLRAWVALARGEHAATLPSLVAAAEAEHAGRDGLALYLLGLSLAEVDDGAERAERALALGQQVLSASSAPLDRMLAARAAALRAQLAPDDQVEARLREALALAPSDPMVHVSVSQRYERLGRRSAAAQHLDRATALGPENALAWYARGQFYFAPSTMDQARSSWRRYLDLAPTGDRAEKVAARLR